ncbi:MAG: Gfo/Idh/MocA family oxidoreductase, partial [Promethearchaeota archaeon]
MRQVKFGIIGAGGAWRFHKLGAKNLPIVQFVSAYDINEKMLQKVEKYSKLKTYTDLNSFLRSDIDAVLIMA